MLTTRTFTPIDGATATVTAANAVKYNIENAVAVNFIFTRADDAGGQSDFKVDVSNDGSTWVQYLKLIKNVTNTNSETLLREGTVNFSATDGTKSYSMSPEDTFRFVRVYVIENTDGTHTAKITYFE